MTVGVILWTVVAIIVAINTGLVAGYFWFEFLGPRARKAIKSMSSLAVQRCKRVGVWRFAVGAGAVSMLYFLGGIGTVAAVLVLSPVWCRLGLHYWRRDAQWEELVYARGPYRVHVRPIREGWYEIRAAGPENGAEKRALAAERPEWWHYYLGVDDAPEMIELFVEWAMRQPIPENGDRAGDMLEEVRAHGESLEHYVNDLDVAPMGVDRRPVRQ